MNEVEETSPDDEGKQGVSVKGDPTGSVV